MNITIYGWSTSVLPGRGFPGRVLSAGLDPGGEIQQRAARSMLAPDLLAARCHKSGGPGDACRPNSPGSTADGSQ
jgi:hypothetical protein